MKKLFRLGGIISLILCFLKFTDIILPQKINYFFNSLSFLDKNITIFILSLLFFYILKKHANHKYCVYSEELKFFAIIFFIILSQLIKFISIFFDFKILSSLVLTIVISSIILFLEGKIYYSLKNKVKDRNYKINMYIFSLAFFIKVIYILSSYLLIFIIEFYKNEVLFDIVNRINEYSNFMTLLLYSISYFFISLIFFRPRERFSF